MAQLRAKDIEEKEEAGRHKKAPQPVYDQRKQAAEAEDSRVRPAEAVLNLQQTYGNKYVQRMMGRVQAKLIVNPPNDHYEKEADRVADAVTRIPASSVQRQAEEEEKEEEGEPIQTKMPQIQRQPAAETKAEAPKAKAGIDKSRVAALKVMFEAAVVKPCGTAYKALKQEKPDPSSAYENLHTALDVIKSMITSYEGVEPMFSRLAATGNALLNYTNALRPHMGAPRPLTEIREDLNKTMPNYFKGIRSQF
jgi:hypothetical protein